MSRLLLDVLHVMLIDPDDCSETYQRGVVPVGAGQQSQLGGSGRSESLPPT